MTKSRFLKKIDLLFTKFRHGFLKKYKTLQKLVDVIVIKNIWSNLHRVVQSAVTNEFKVERLRKFLSN